jgi:hypothetical protein
MPRCFLTYCARIFIRCIMEIYSLPYMIGKKWPRGGARSYFSLIRFIWKVWIYVTKGDDGLQVLVLGSSGASLFLSCFFFTPLRSCQAAGMNPGYCYRSRESIPGYCLPGRRDESPATATGGGNQFLATATGPESIPGYCYRRRESILGYCLPGRRG